MNNTTAWAMLLAYLNLSNTGGSVEPMPLWEKVIIIACLCVLMILLAFATYELVSDYLEYYKQKKRRKELWKK